MSVIVEALILCNGSDRFIRVRQLAAGGVDSRSVEIFARGGADGMAESAVKLTSRESGQFCQRAGGDGIGMVLVQVIERMDQAGRAAFA